MNRNLSLRCSYVILTLVLFQFSLPAQIKNYLPYSIFGIGEINPKGFGRNMAMGRTGIALSSGMYLNNMNPASYHDMDSISFFFDFGLSGNFVKYSTNTKTQHGHDINIRNVALGFRITRHWTASFGIRPYSTVAYQITSTKNVQGTTDLFRAKLTGSGGLSQFYLDNSYELFNHLSLGVNASYLFGNVESLEDIQFEKLSFGILSKQSSRLNKLYVDFGFQYFANIHNNLRLTVGGVFGNKHQLNFKENILISQTDGIILDDKITRTGTFDLPLYYGVGLAVNVGGNMTFSADYLYNDWSSVTAENTKFEYTSTHAFRIGAEYIPAKKYQFSYFGRLVYRAGYYHEDSYIKINNTDIGDNGFSLGIGIPFMKNRTSVNLSYNMGIKGTLTNGLIKENYNSFLLSLTLHDWWFIKPKYD